MKLRRLFIIDKKSLKLIYAKAFIISECFPSDSEVYCRIPPSNEKIIDAFFERFSVDSEYIINFKPDRDSCDRKDWSPILSLLVCIYRIFVQQYRF